VVKQGHFPNRGHPGRRVLILPVFQVKRSIHIFDFAFSGHHKFIGCHRISTNSPQIKGGPVHFLGRLLGLRVADSTDHGPAG
jgi:hypothetical protein